MYVFRNVKKPLWGAGCAILLVVCCRLDPAAAAFDQRRGLRGGSTSSAPSLSPALDRGIASSSSSPSVVPAGPTRTPSKKGKKGGADRESTQSPTSPPTSATTATHAPTLSTNPGSGNVDGATSDDTVVPGDDCTGSSSSESIQDERENFMAAVLSWKNSTTATHTVGSDPTGLCSIAPPSIRGGCGPDCILNRFLQAGATAVIGNVPYVGGFLSNLVGLFWPNGPDAAVTLLNETVTYINAQIAAAESTVLLDVISGYYNTILQEIFILNQLIQDNDSNRDHTLGSILNDCNLITSQLIGATQTDPVPRLAIIGGAGQACIAMWVAKIYHSNETTGLPPPSNQTFDTYKQELDQMVQTYIDLAGNATQEALTARMNQITFHNNGDAGLCGFFEHKNIATVQDSACYAAGGPPAYLSNLVGYGEQCHVAFVEPTPFIQMYQTIVQESFTDNMLSVSRSMIPLWKLQTSANLDAGVQPTPIIRAASSLIDSYWGLNITNADDGFTAPTTEMAAIYNTYNGPISQGQPSDRISDIMFAQIQEDGYNSVAGMVVTQVIGGQTQTIQNGGTHMCDTPYNHYTLHLAENERIVAVGAFDCNDANFVQDGHCESLGAAVKTVLVDATGKFVSVGQVWNPMGYPESGPWIEAPALAQANNNTFVPYIISFNGWATENFLSSKAPVWLYQSLE